MYKLLALACVTYFFACSSFAAPRAQSAEECGIAWRASTTFPNPIAARS